MKKPKMKQWKYDIKYTSIRRKIKRITNKQERQIVRKLLKQGDNE